jgi:ATP-binding cassette subfamily B protein
MTAIIGPSGSGKSTVLSLIARFWDVKEGSITIGGVDVKEIKCDSLFDNISAVFQKAYLFHDTVFNNIRFGNPEATREQVINAAQKAHCHEFIRRLEKGYDTVVGEGGATLSGGERQRISIARAMLKNAPIVLLDEVTANIDPENEMLIQQAIQELVQAKTIFIVAHKLATIQNADQILVLNDQGQICESGTHDQLIKNNGLYTFLWNKSQKVSNWTIAV